MPSAALTITFDGAADMRLFLDLWRQSRAAARAHDDRVAGGCARAALDRIADLRVDRRPLDILPLLTVE